MIRIPARAVAAGAAVAVAATSLFAVGTAGAVDPTTTTTPGATTTTLASAIQPVKSNVTGNLKVTGTPGLDIPIPEGSFIEGTFDNSTGALNGTFTSPDGVLPNLSFNVDGVGAVTGNLTYRLVSGGPATGTVDLATNKVTVTATQSLKLVTLALTAPLALDVPFAEGCVVGPIQMNYTGTYDPATQKVNLTSAAAELKAIPDGACGTAPVVGSDLTAPVNALIAGQTATATVAFALAVQEIKPPAKPEAPKAPPAKTAAPAPTAKPATPMAKNASYTG